MSKATVWWNGPSVKQFYDIPQQNLEIGCNFILDNRKVHHVCVYDRPVMIQIEKNPNPDVKYWTRRNLGTSIFNTFESQIKYKHYRGISGFCSGTLALAVAVQMGATELDLLGCDWSLTNASMYDKQYTWRKFQPNKTSKDKFKFLQIISEMVQLNIVHHKPREWGANIQWMTPEDYLAKH